MAHPAALARFQARVAAAQGRGPARSKPCDSSTLCQLQPDWHPASLVAVGRSSSGADADDPAHRYKLLRAGVSSAGDGSRLRRVLRLAARGAPLVVAALGASVTSDFGGSVGWMQTQFALGYSGRSDWCRSRGPECVDPGFLLPIGDMLWSLRSRAAGAPPSNATSWGAERSNSSNVVVVNTGMAGHKLDTYSQCMSSKLPAEADLVIVDAATIPQDEATTERIIRQLLALPRRPAIILLHLANWCWHSQQNSEQARADARNLTCYSPERLVGAWSKGAYETEGMLDDLAAYYGLPALSLRRALFAASLRAASDDFFKPWVHVSDGLHPASHSHSGGGGSRASSHKERYPQLIAAMVNTFLFDAAVRLRHDDEAAAAADAAKAAAAPPPAATTAGAPSAGRRLGEAWSERVRLTPRLDGELLSSPCWVLYKKTDTRSAGRTERCYAWGADLSRRPEFSPAPVLPGSSGWNYTEFDNAKEADARDRCVAERGNAVLCIKRLRLKSKPGVTAFSVGARALIRLDLTDEHVGTRGAAQLSPPSGGVGGMVPAELSLTYLSSYEAMGTVRVACVRGCKCEPLTIDAHRGKEEKVMLVSIWKTEKHPLQIRDSGRAQACLISLTVLEATRSGGHKFKVGQLALSWRPSRAADGAAVGASASASAAAAAGAVGDAEACEKLRAATAASVTVRGKLAAPKPAPPNLAPSLGPRGRGAGKAKGSGRDERRLPPRTRLNTVG